MNQSESRLNKLEKEAFALSKKVCTKYLHALGKLVKQDQDNRKKLKNLTIKVHSV